MKSQKKATIFGLLAVLCWSTVATVFKLSLQFVTPVQLILVASIASWALLLLLLGWQGRLKQLFDQSRRQYLLSFCFGLMNPALYYLLLFYAYDSLPAQEAQAINHSWAIVMSLLAVPLLGQRLSRYDITAAIVCYLGVLVIATRGNLLAFEFANITGVMLAIASTLVWSLYWIFNQKDQREEILGLCLNFSYAVPVIVLFCWITGEFDGLTSESAWRGVLGGVYVGFIEMGLGFVFWLFAMKRAINTSKITNLVFIAPFLSLVLISLFLGELIMLSTLFGLTLIILGLLVQQVLGMKYDDTR